MRMKAVAAVEGSDRRRFVGRLGGSGQLRVRHLILLAASCSQRRAETNSNYLIGYFSRMTLLNRALIPESAHLQRNAPCNKGFCGQITLGCTPE